MMRNIDYILEPVPAIVEISISDLCNNPYQKRKQPGDIKSLANNIAERGLMNPISVVKSGNKYTIVSGHRRVLAYKFLRRKLIPAIIRKESTEKDLALDVAVENLMRDDLKPNEKAETILQMIYTSIPNVKNDPSRAMTIVSQLKLYNTRGEVGNQFLTKIGFTESDLFVCRKILKLVGMSENTVIQYFRILQLPDAIQDQVEAMPNGMKTGVNPGKISVKMAYELTRVNNPRLQEELYSKVTSEKMKYIDTKFLVDQIIKQEPELMNCNRECGTAAQRMQDDGGLAKLTESCLRVGSAIWNFRPKVPLIKKRLDKLQFIAAITKLKKTCLEMVAHINKILHDNQNQEEVLEYINANLEIELTSPSRGEMLYRYSLPKDKIELLHLNQGDRLVLEIKSVIRKEG